MLPARLYRIKCTAANNSHAPLKSWLYDGVVKGKFCNFAAYHHIPELALCNFVCPNIVPNSAILKTNLKAMKGYRKVGEMLQKWVDLTILEVKFNIQEGFMVDKVALEPVFRG